MDEQKNRTKKKPEEMTSFPVKVKVCFQDEYRIFHPTKSERVVYMLSMFKKLGKRLPKKRNMWFFLCWFSGLLNLMVERQASSTSLSICLP